MQLNGFFILATIALSVSDARADVIQLDSNNFDKVLQENDIVFLNFYAVWCRFCQMLEPIYNEFGKKFSQEILPAGVRAAVARIDCDAEPALASRYQISKYPTLKLYRYGAISKREYRGARTADAFIEFMREQMKSPITHLDYSTRLNNIELIKRGAIVGFFDSNESDNYKEFTKISNILRDTCNFAAAIGDFAKPQRTDKDRVIYRSLNDAKINDIDYPGEIADYNALYSWVSDQCIKLVREITFENAEELTEEGLPFLILFYKPGDMKSIQDFEKQVSTQLAHEKGNINAVYADGNKFSHPLHHLGKSASDLPVLAIDSFRHMYLFANMNNFNDGYSLNKFVQDLKSGKLHREFHNGPDPVEVTPKPNLEEILNAQANAVHIPKGGDNHNDNKRSVQTDPPESAFHKLKPSNNRYTILKDEF